MEPPKDWRCTWTLSLFPPLPLLLDICVFWLEAKREEEYVYVHLSVTFHINKLIIKKKRGIEILDENIWTMLSTYNVSMEPGWTRFLRIPAMVGQKRNFIFSDNILSTKGKQHSIFTFRMLGQVCNCCTDSWLLRLLGEVMCVELWDKQWQHFLQNTIIPRLEATADQCSVHLCGFQSIPSNSVGSTFFCSPLSHIIFSFVLKYSLPTLNTKTADE